MLKQRTFSRRSYRVTIILRLEDHKEFNLTRFLNSYGPTLLTKVCVNYDPESTTYDMPAQRAILWTEFITTPLIVGGPK